MRAGVAPIQAWDLASGFRMTDWYAGSLFIAALLLATGLVIVRYRSTLAAWWRRLREARQRVHAEDALKYIHNCELRGHPATPDSLMGALGLGAGRTIWLITRLEAQGLLRSSADGLSLTAQGVRLALQVIRAHRLWERYLVDEARMPLARVHAEAERREHAPEAAALDALEAAMGHPATDPHGDPIPTSGGELAALPAWAITNWPTMKPARIVHLEDEPPAIFAQIAAVGLQPGQTIWVVEADARRIVLTDGEETHVLAPVVAANVFVVPLDVAEPPVARRRLTSLATGQQATVHSLDDALQGFTRRRLLDLGLTPGVGIRAELRGCFRDPVAYRVRGSLIALRRDQAEHVRIEVADPVEPSHV